MVTVTVLVQSAEYVQLGDAKKVSFPETTVTSMVGIEEKTSGCLVASSFTWCGPRNFVFLSLSLFVVL